MKRFILMTQLFIAIIALYFFVNYLTNLYIIRKNPPVIKASTLIMGDSHIMTGIDPAKFHSALNISQSAEPYAATYFKLREIIKHNHIDTLILGFSAQNLSEFNDQKFTDQFWSDELFDRLYPITSWSDYNSYEINKMSFAKSLVKNMLLFPKLKHHAYLGKFLKKTGDIKTTKQKANGVINRHFYYDNNESIISQLCVQYMDSIFQTSRKCGIKLILINTPVHHTYRSLIPAEFAKHFKQLETKLKKQGVTIINLSELNLDDSHFTDFDHVNIRGAAKVTDEVKMRIRQLN